MNLIITSPSPKVKWIELDNKEKRNALTHNLILELNHEIQLFEKSSDKVLVISGGEAFFSSGVDLSEMHKESSSSMIEKNKVGPEWEDLYHCTKPTIACVSGMCYGGGLELALMCDMIVASLYATFRLPELSIGTIPGIGGSVRLSRLIGHKAASHLIFSSGSLHAARAFELGMINQLTNPEQLITSTLNLAIKIASQSLPLLQKAKKAMRFDLSLQEALYHEKDLFYSTFDLADQKEGMEAFLEKRPAVFRDE